MVLYHVWFATKSRKWLLQGDVVTTVKGLLQSTAAENGIELLECETMVDHVHLLLRLEDQRALSQAMNLVKGVSARRLGEQFPELKLDVGIERFWQHRYRAKAVPEAASASVAGYIRTQWRRVDKYDR